MQSVVGEYVTGGRRGCDYELVLPMASAVVSRPNTRNGCAAAWYFTSFATGSGRKNLNWKKICSSTKDEQPP